MAVKERENGFQVKEAAANLKNYLVGLSRKQKIMIGAIVGAAVLAAVILAVALNSGTPEYRPLYTGLDATEATSIYAALQEMGADAQMDADGVILVRTQEYDQLLLALAAQGYPKSTNAYDIFSSHTGLTATESEKKTYLLYQLQSTLENTIRRIGGVRGAVVTIVIPETSTYVWQQTNDKEASSAGVLLTLDPGVTFNAEQVTTIKNLVSSSVPKLEASGVTVVNAATSLELFGAEEDAGTSLAGNKGLMLEQQVQKQIEDNIVRLLTPRYGKNGVVAAAKVTLDLDKMLTEQRDYTTQTPNPDGTGGGYNTRTEVTWGVNGEQPLTEGVVGEENNTDFPGYAYGTAPNQNGGATSYRRLTDTEYGYITTQIERGNYVLQRATISVLVDESSMTAARTQELTNLISTGADIPAAEITVGAFRTSAETAGEPTAPEEPAAGFWPPPMWVWYLAGGFVLLILISIAAILIIRRRIKHRVLAHAAELENNMQSMEDELEKYKRDLEAAAKAASDPKDEIIMNEVRDFAKHNPEITANLLKSWMREEE